MTKFVDQSPDPKSHIKTLMHIGYTLNSAISDLIDNSITAGAKNIEIFAPPGLDSPIISIIDDGCGMESEELIQNMRIGCKDPRIDREKGDLGRFGSGLKTASFSQALQLTVITKKQGSPPTAARWDIQEIERTNSWCLEVFESHELSQIEGYAGNFPFPSGTQIIWDKLICIDEGSHIIDKDKELAAKISELKSHIALHFHRFMLGANKRTFSINRGEINPIDPFMKGANGYQEGPSERLRCKGGHIEISTHVLPHFNKMDPMTLERMGGAEGITQNQGIYIYREKRLIQAGGWMGMNRNSQLGALARVQVDIPAALDNDWATDVKKETLQIPARVKGGLRKFMADPVKRSKKVYSYKGKTETANEFWKICEDENTKKITYLVDPNNSALENIFERFLESDKSILVSYLNELAKNLPINHIYEKMAERPNDIQQDELDMSILESIFKKVF